MKLWQLDVMGGIALADGGEAKAVTGIDDHSRFCVAVGLVRRASSRPVCGVFARALATHGVPQQVLTDNGKVFTGRYAGRPVEVLFDRISSGERHRAPADRGALAHHDRQDRTVPRHPRRECLAGRVFADIGRAQSVIDAWVVEYNTDRPHQSLGRCTPAERFATHAPDTGPALALTALSTRRDGDDWVSRRVASNGIVCVVWQQVSVGEHHRGELVDVHVTDRLLEFGPATTCSARCYESRKERFARSGPPGPRCPIVRVKHQPSTIRRASGETRQAGLPQLWPASVSRGLVPVAGTPFIGLRRDVSMRERTSSSTGTGRRRTLTPSASWCSRCCTSCPASPGSRTMTAAGSSAAPRSKFP